MVQLSPDGKLPEAANEVFRSYGSAFKFERLRAVSSRVLAARRGSAVCAVSSGAVQRLQRIGGRGGRGRLSKFWTAVGTGARLSAVLEKAAIDIAKRNLPGSFPRLEIPQPTGAQV